MEEMNITGTLRTNDQGESYTFSVKAFKTWKKRFQIEYVNQFGTSFKGDLPDSQKRESAYKPALHMGGIDIFQTGSPRNSLPLQMYDRVVQIGTILSKK